ncbi:hypothetical protein D6D18_08589 [Aureobasidium pullulans]|uniref:Uncharacterized protein n=1 Tax=Aureobasidium pullulans TaxID=5580 RepID=A0A4S9APQ5_AURPU|nr:hypothetical protein D6D24_08742 [Aureobasidium pullulans]THW81902.1 hypothetical protein D6D18_08589 [Aureobasidium pullulans]
MPDTIVSARAAPASDELLRVLRGHWSTCNSLVERTKKNLYTTNSYLASGLGRVTYSLNCAKHCLTSLERDANIRTLNVNATATLRRAELQSLKAIRDLESIIRPVKDEWTEVSEDISRQISAIAWELHRQYIDMWLIKEISKLTSGSQTPSEAFRVGLKERKSDTAMINKISRDRRQDTKEMMKHCGSLVPKDNLSSDSNAGLLTPSGGWSEFHEDDGQEAPPQYEKSGRSMAGTNLAHCEGLVVGYLELLDTRHTGPETRAPSHLTDSPGRLLLRHACKTLANEMAIATETEDAEPLSEKKKVDTTSDDIIEAMSASITHRDIATLIFHWTTWNKVNGFSRV